MARDWVFTWRVTEEEKDVVRKAVGHRIGIPPSRVTRRNVEAWFIGAIEGVFETLAADIPDEDEQED